MRQMDWLEQVHIAADGMASPAKRLGAARSAMVAMLQYLVAALNGDGGDDVSSLLAALRQDGLVSGDVSLWCHMIDRFAKKGADAALLKEPIESRDVEDVVDALQQLSQWFTSCCHFLDTGSASQLVAYEDGDWLDTFGLIEFPKTLFQKVPADIRRKFCKRFPQILYNYYRVVKEGGSGKNDIKIYKGSGYQDVKCRLDGNFRLFWYVTDGDDGTILHVTAIASHDRQDSQRLNLKRADGLQAGNVYWQVRPLLERLRTYQVYRRTYYTEHELAQYVAAETNFVYDTVQDDIVRGKTFTSTNLSVIGNAGSGKSLVGEGWIAKRLAHREGCIYLTLSRNLTEQKREEFKKQQTIARREEALRTGTDAMRPSVEFDAIFDFMKKAVIRQLDAEGRDTSIVFLDGQQSFYEFCKVCEGIDEGWRKLNKLAVSRGAQVVTAWRKIHGILKGGVPGKDVLDLTAEPIFTDEHPRVTTDEYDQREQKKNKAADSLDDEAMHFVRDVLMRRYEVHLMMHRAWDDNDMADFILSHCQPSMEYDAAFIDECQDLTEKELLALSYLLKNCLHKLMSSDRCQIIQPTLFNPSVMITNANRVSGAERSGAKPQFLHYNYRSTEEIVAFQEYIMNVLTAVSSLHEEERVPIEAMSGNCGKKPVWIVHTKENLIALRDMLKGLDESYIKVLRADKNLAGEGWFAGPGSGQTLEDMFDCKGLEYPAVLLWNVLSDTDGLSADPAWSWRYFYVGATRAQKRLLIFEAKDDGEAFDFLSQAAVDGVVTRVDDLAGSYKGKLTWRCHLVDWLSDVAEDDQLLLAENYRTVGEFAAAARIYQRFIDQGYEDEYLHCHAKDCIGRGDYDEALRAYFRLDDGRDEIAAFLEEDVPTTVYLAGRLFYMADDGYADEAIAAIRDDYFKRFGRGETFDEALRAMTKIFPVVKGKIIQWKEMRWHQLSKGLGQLDRLMEEGTKTWQNSRR